jgi:hypothetical protein
MAETRPTFEADDAQMSSVDTQNRQLIDTAKPAIN